MNENILSIDCGTQSLRAIIFDRDGNILDKEKIEYRPYNSPLPGWAEQNPLVFRDAMSAGCRALAIRSPEAFRAVAGVGVTSQRDTMINLGADGSPLRPAVTWLDTRSASGSYRPNPLMKALYRAVGMEKILNKVMKDAKCNWIRENQPEIWELTDKYVEVSGYLNRILCGEAVDSVASMVGHIPFNNRKRNWAAPNEVTSRLCPVEKEKQYRLVEPGEQAGCITSEASAETGLPEGLPVIACGSDKACETLGTGSLDTSSASLSFGTTATVEVCTRRYFEPLPYLPSYCAAYPGSWVAEVEIYRGYWMVSWFRDELGHKELEEARRSGVVPEELLNRLLAENPPGCMGLMMQPYWGPGLKDPMAKGSFIGFGDTHTRGSMYRALIEGIGYALREGLETLEGRGRFKSEEIYVSGGASQSDAICQISADIFGRPHRRGKTYETSALGAAILTAAGLGIHNSVDQAVARMVSYERTFTPDPGNSETYNRLFEVYRKIYPRLSGLYGEIRDITGYPEL